MHLTTYFEKLRRLWSGIKVLEERLLSKDDSEWLRKEDIVYAPPNLCWQSEQAQRTC